MTEKQGLLPLVSEDVCYAVQAELHHSKENEFVIELLRRLEKDNPLVANFIAQFSLTTEDPVGATYAGLLVYRLLESQADANNLNKSAKF